MAKPQVVELQAEVRENGRKSLNALRNAKRVPGVLYGPKLDTNISFSMDELEIENLLAERKRQIVELKVDGQVYKTLLKSYDTHPVSDRVIHADFYALADDHKVTLSIPIHLEGTAIGVTEGGGRIFQPLHVMRIRVNPEHIPGEYTVDITNLGIAESIHVRDLDLDGITPIDDLSRAIVTVRPPKSDAQLASSLTTEEPATEEGEETEEGAEAVEGEESTGEAGENEGDKE